MYEAIGGSAVIEKLVDDFYRIMATDPEARECFATHSGKEIKDSAEKLKMFLSGWLGGPKLYLEKIGHPRLRMRHFPFKIGLREAAQWLYCMKKAFELSTITPELQLQILEAFRNVTEIIKNRD
jgi:hemoglobin